MLTPDETLDTLLLLIDNEQAKLAAFRPLDDDHIHPNSYMAADAYVSTQLRILELQQELQQYVSRMAVDDVG